VLAERGRATPPLRTRHVRRHGGTPGVVQLVSLELAIVALIAASLTGDPIVIAAVGVAAAVLLAAVLGRVDGRWLYEEAGARRRIRQRRAEQARAVAALRRRAAGAAGAAGVEPLTVLAPDCSIIAVADRGRTIGVGSDDDGWFAGLAVGSLAEATGPASPPITLDQLAKMLEESSVPVSVLQLVVYSRPPAGGVANDKSSAKAALPVRSYLELLGPESCPVEQAVWLAVRLKPEDAIDAAQSRGGGVEGVHRALAAALGRIEKALSAASVRHRVLDADGLRQALAHACAVESATPVADPAASVRERWASWTSGGVAHASFTVTRWPPSAEPTLLAELARIPARAVNISLSVRRSGDRIAFSGVVRVIAQSDRLRAGVRALTRTAGRLGVKVRRLDGEQAPAVYASAPTGGGAW
jgi:type VII secretion protein EccE